MTVIAVRKYSDKIIIAADSQETWGANKIIDCCKIVKQNDLVVGCSGNSLSSALFEMFIRTHKPKRATEEDVVDFLSEFVDWKKKKTNNDEHVGQMILIMDGVIFNIYTYTVYRIVTDFSAVGSGMFAALVAMDMGADPRAAVKVVNKYDVYCSGKVESLEISVRESKKSG